MRVAIVHYWLLNQRGGERTLEAFCRMFPQAEIYTLFYDPDRVSEFLRSRRVHASWLNPFRRFYQTLLPLMPMALESFDLQGYDLVISHESGPAKGVLAPASAHHVCYCPTPMRYLWELYPNYLREWTPRWKRPALIALSHYLRLWDRQSAQGVDQFIAGSENARRRIGRAWGREATVIHPPVDVEEFYWKPPEDYYLIVSELVAYKRIDAAVRAFGKPGRRLVVVGKGPELAALRREAGPQVEFRGWVSKEELRECYARCRALLMPGEEDFGMTPVEAMASGKPVIALGRGGVLESVPLRDPVGGVFFDEPGAEALEAAIERFEAIEDRVEPAELQAHAARFSEAAFRQQFLAEIQRITGKTIDTGMAAEAVHPR